MLNPSRADTCLNTAGAWLLALLCAPAFGYIAFSPDYLANRWPLTSAFAPTTLEIILSFVGIALVLEATRRLTGWVLVVGTLAALAYAYLGEFLPDGMISHRGFSIIQIIDFMYLTVDGIWGTALGVAATYIVVFIIFFYYSQQVTKNAMSSHLLIYISLLLTGKRLVIVKLIEQIR